MKNLQLKMAVAELGSRNASILSAYRDWARAMPPGPASRLASSMATQRFELGQALGEMATELLGAGSQIEVEFEVEPSPAAAIEAAADQSPGPVDPKRVLAAMIELENGEVELLAAMAGAVLPRSSAAAERLAGEASSARKRALWAQDHLELLGMA